MKKNARRTIILSALLSVIGAVACSQGNEYGDVIQDIVNAIPTRTPTFAPTMSPTATSAPTKTPTVRPTQTASPQPAPIAVRGERVNIAKGTTTLLSNNWRVDEFLWKPVAEHYEGLAIVTLPREDVTKVVVRKCGTKAFIKQLPFRSVGSAGDAFADYTLTGAEYEKRYGCVLVDLSSKKKGLVRFRIKRPSSRSDGLIK